MEALNTILLVVLAVIVVIVVVRIITAPLKLIFKLLINTAIGYLVLFGIMMNQTETSDNKHNRKGSPWKFEQ